MTFKEGLPSAYRAFHPEGALLLLPKRVCLVQRAAAWCRFQRCGEQGEIGSKSYFKNLLTTGHVHKSYVEGIPSSFSIWPKLGLSKLHL